MFDLLLGIPRKGEGNLVGYINNIDLTEGRITALATPTTDGTYINATVDNIPPEICTYRFYGIDLILDLSYLIWCEKEV